MTWLSVLRPQWEIVAYPWDQAEQDFSPEERQLHTWEPFATDRLQDGTTLVYCRRRVPFGERVRRYRARHDAADAAPPDHDQVPEVPPGDEADDEGAGVG